MCASGEWTGVSVGCVLVMMCVGDASMCKEHSVQRDVYKESSVSDSIAMWRGQCMHQGVYRGCNAYT